VLRIVADIPKESLGILRTDMFSKYCTGTKIWLQMYQMCWQLWERKLIKHTERADKWIEEDCGMDYRIYLPAAPVGDFCAGGLRIGCIVLEFERHWLNYPG